VLTVLYIIRVLDRTLKAPCTTHHPPPGSSSPDQENSGDRIDAITLQSLLRDKERELAYLREDSASKGKELMAALQLLQGANTQSEGLRRQVADYERQLAITRDALGNFVGAASEMLSGEVVPATPEHQHVEQAQREEAKSGGEEEQRATALLPAAPAAQEAVRSFPAARDRSASELQARVDLLEEELRRGEESREQLEAEVISLRRLMQSAGLGATTGGSPGSEMSQQAEGCSSGGGLPLLTPVVESKPDSAGSRIGGRSPFATEDTQQAVFVKDTVALSGAAEVLGTVAAPEVGEAPTRGQRRRVGGGGMLARAGGTVLAARAIIIGVQIVQWVLMRR
jgi:hypothetical protein